MKYVYFQPDTFTIGLADGNFIKFYWNGKLEESYLPLFEEEDYWIKIGEFDER